MADQQNGHETQVPAAALAELDEALAEVNGQSRDETEKTPDPQPKAVTTDTDHEAASGQRTDEQVGISKAGDAWEQKYRSEVPRLQSFVKSKDAEIAELRAKLESKGDDSGTVRLPDGDKVTNLLDQIPESVRLDLGEENVEAILKVALANQNSAKMEQLDEVVQTFQQQKADKMYDDLDRMKPDWEAIGQSDEFLAFCGTFDNLTGVMYQDVLNAAHERGDSAAVIEVFKRFEANRGQQAPKSNSGQSLPSLLEQVTPDGQPLPSVDSASDGQDTMTLDQWEMEMDRVATKTNLNPIQADARLKQLQAAMNEGRVLDNGHSVNPRR